MTSSPDIHPADLKVFLNHVYEYKNGVRRMVLYTVNRKYEAFAVARLKSQHIAFVIQPVTENSINLFFAAHGNASAEPADTRRRLHPGGDVGI